ncbi:MAG TPA: HAMP domain-containing sensor histidine kinase [Methyloceanibacter sp.]|nr:HAMP domain-containing sensor histidine kinase [Methyloceanibacter sp.]
MADLRSQRRIEDGDREALEHIARALEGRVLLGPGAMPPAPDNTPVPVTNGVAETTPPASPLALPPESLRLLLEAMPAAIGLVRDGTLIYLNSAFAYAFGYRSPSELSEAGGLDAILPGGSALLVCEEDTGRTGEIDALTRSRRRIKVVFALSPLDTDQDTEVLRLIDQADLEAEAPAPVAAQPAPEILMPEMPTPAAQTPETPALMTPATVAEVPAPAPAPRRSVDPDAAGRRLDFLAKVSHEVRTPLNSIIGFAELMLQERFGAIGNARYKGYTEDIHQSGLYALSLLNDLLDISKIEAGKFELDFTAVDVGEVVETCVASLQPLAKRTRIVLRTSLAQDLPLVVADPRRLKQTLLNLLTNAIKFTTEGGQVIVSGTLVEGELRVRVRDSGVGMTKNEIAYAMQPFHQLDTAPRRQSGTGLGLPLTKALADANRARLELSSEPGVGTSADVIFPAERLFSS